MPEDSTEHQGDKSSSTDLLCPIDSMGCVLAFATKDWAADKNDAWIYGVIAGWDDESLEELKVKFKWDSETVARLKALHASCQRLRA